MLRSILPSNQFYRTKFSDVNTEQVDSLSDFSRNFPFTTKAEIVADQAAAPPFGTNLTFPLDQYSRFHQTSGSTGTPIRWLDTEQNWRSMVQQWATIFDA